MMRRFARQFRMCKKSERTDAIGDGDNHHAFVREAVAPVQGHCGRAVDVAATVDPDDHGQALGRGLYLCRCPDVEVETILTYRGWGLARHGYSGLHASRGKVIRFARSGPGCDRSGRMPTQVTDRWGCEWDAFVHVQPIFVEYRVCT